MPRNCHECKETKGLKAIQVPYCDDPEHNHGDWSSACICQSCYSICSCEEDSHAIEDCLEDPECPNHKKTKAYWNNWDHYDYHWKLKKQYLSLEGN